MQIPILSGIYADPAPGFRTSYPRNLVPVPKATGIAQGYLRPADGIEPWATGPGPDRGGIVWQGACHRVSGTKLVRVSEDGAVAVLGDVGPGGPVRLDYSFDRLIIASGGRLYYCDGSTVTQVTDGDLGEVLSACWIAGYTLATDGTSLVVTELNDPTAVNPLKYGSAESDPDNVLAVARLRGEAYALGRHTIEAFQNVGGDLFPFQRIDGAQVQKGVIGTHAWCHFAETIAIVGSGRGEAPAVYLMGPGSASRVSTAEIDRLLSNYSETELASLVAEARVDRGHQHLLLHLPDRTLVYDLAASKVVGEPVWFTLDSGTLLGPAQYRARGLVWCYGHWIAGDPASGAIGRLTDAVSTHHGASIGWEFGTMAVYNDGQSAIVHELELVALPGRVALGADPMVWTSYSLDGETWSQERPARAGAQGQRLHRIAWRRQGRIGHYRMQRIRGTSAAHIAVARLEARLEPLITRPGNA